MLFRSALARLAADGTVIVAAARGETLRQRPGHWTSIVRRSRTGVVLAGLQSAADGDLLGVTLPRGFPVDARPGRGWLVDHGDVSVAQLAVDTAATATDGPPVFGHAPVLDDPFGVGGRRGSPDGHR